MDAPTAILFCVLGWSLGAVPLLIFWSQLESAQCLTGLLLWLVLPLVLFLIQPVQHPGTREIFWRTPWNVPRYEDPQMGAVLTPELIEQLKATAPVDPEIRENSVNREMPRSHSMSRIKDSLAVLIALVLWFVLPEILDKFLMPRGDQGSSR